MKCLLKDVLMWHVRMYVFLSSGHLHNLLDPIYIKRHTDEDVWLAGVSAAAHWYDDSLQNPTVTVLTGQRAAIVSLEEQKRRTLQRTCSQHVLLISQAPLTSIATTELKTRVATQRIERKCLKL